MIALLTFVVGLLAGSGISAYVNYRKKKPMLELEEFKLNDTIYRQIEF